MNIVAPCGGSLVNLLGSPEQADELRRHAERLPSLQVSERTACDLELLATGAFSPLDRFMGRGDYERVLGEMRLASGHLFPIPITLPVDPSAPISLDAEITLRDSRNELLAIMTVEEVYDWDLEEEARRVLGTLDPRHPVVAEMHRWGRRNLSGHLRVVQVPRHYDFEDLRMTPARVRRALEERKRAVVVAFQTRNPLHRGHEELTRRAIREADATLLLHPVVGLTRPGDVDHYTRVRTYRALAEARYEPDRVVLALLPLAMRMAGPREALWHALIRRNYGANRFILGRDHASPGLDGRGRPFYPPYAAQELLHEHSAELGVQPVPFREMVYLPGEDRYEEVDRIPPDTRTVSLSGTHLRNGPLPEWLVRPEVGRILAERRRGACLWFTGLSCSGKSTTAEVLTVLLLEKGHPVTLLDGDVVRTHLSQGLGFSKHDRDVHLRRMGFVASEVVRHGGIAVCAAISPYRATRNEVRAMVGSDRFVEIFMDTPLSVCERRDAKGLYARARRGELEGFTGVDAPYEEPLNPELVLETLASTPEGNARRVLEYLERLRPGPSTKGGP
ncbi:MAG: bifunctional sulfate adenylyltransferase/adenylylsulfate kinase [Candidatus Eremiobacterota bacterium]